MSKMPPAPRSRVNRRDFLRGATAAARATPIVPRHLKAMLKNKNTEAMARDALHGLQAK